LGLGSWGESVAALEESGAAEAVGSESVIR
jgi:hypothetical protein